MNQAVFAIREASEAGVLMLRFVAAQIQITKANDCSIIRKLSPYSLPLLFIYLIMPPPTYGYILLFFPIVKCLRQFFR